MSLVIILDMHITTISRHDLSVMFARTYVEVVKMPPPPIPDNFRKSAIETRLDSMF